MILGAGITIIVQSSSITTSALTPMVGLGIIRLEQVRADFAHALHLNCLPDCSNVRPAPSRLLL